MEWLRWIVPAHVGCRVSSDGGRRIQNDRLDDQWPSDTKHVAAASLRAGSLAVIRSFTVQRSACGRGLATTAAKLVFDLIVHHLRVTGSTVLVGLAAFNIMAIALLADLLVRRTADD